MNHIRDFTGQRFGKLTVIELTDKRTKSKNVIWKCKCDCGNTTEADSGELGSGSKKSCGCIVSERAKTLNRTHGGRNDRLYLVWMDMRRRCRDVNDHNYTNYGGRGIKVCDEWQNYPAFKEWAIKNGYNPYAERSKCTLDRINVNGNYEPSNCRWVDVITQCNNKRNNRLITHNGITQTITMWAREYDMKPALLHKRLNAGWDFERAVSTPSRYETISHSLKAV